MRFETCSCVAPQTPDTLAGFRERGMGKGEWVGLGMDRARGGKRTEGKEREGDGMGKWRRG